MNIIPRLTQIGIVAGFLGAWGFLPGSIYANNIKLNEQSLIEWSRTPNPTQKAITAKAKAAQVEQEQREASFGSLLSTSLSYSTSEASSLIPQQPVFRPSESVSIGIGHVSPLGIKASADVFAEQVSTADGFLDQSTNSGIQFGVEVDLWRNLLGRVDQLELRSSDLTTTASQIRNQLEQKEFEMELRKLYWSMVANESSRNISRNLLDSAKKQLKESKQRLRDKVADQGEVARNRALVKSRETSLLFFDYQRELLETQLTSLLPQLQGKTLTLSEVNLTQQEKKVGQCIAKITSEAKVPANFSDFDQLVTVLKQAEQNQLERASWIDSMDVKIGAQIKHSTVDQGYSDSFGNLSADGRPTSSVMLEIQVPLNPKLSAVERTSKTLARLSSQAEYERIQAQLASEHQKVKTSLILLLQAIQSQGATNQDLETSLEETQKKYRQARVSLNSLILEQDSYFNSRLAEIDTKHQAIHLIYDYFKVFNQYPCGINTI